MSRPQSEAEYLARMVPASVAATSMRRRSVLKGAAGAGAAFSVPALLAACGGSSTPAASSSSSGSAGGKTVSFGSYQSDAVPKKSLAAVMDAYKAKSGNTVKINTVDHNTFQENINNYLQAKPDDVFTWFAGYRMRFFASQGLAGDISDVWADPQMSGFTDAFKKAATGDDGKQYLVPVDYYPWAVFYLKSVWAKYGYTVPTTLDELTALGAKMKKDGLVPIAFGDKDGWPAMGTFDILNMRINGYDFHIELMAHKHPWTDPKVQKVFDTWKGLLPLHQEGSLGRTWQEAAGTLQKKQAGMYLLGLFVGQQFSAAEQSDLDFFTFPTIDTNIGNDALDAPIDGDMMAKAPKDEAAAKSLLAYIGSKEAETVAAKNDPSLLYPNSGVDTAGYSALQKKGAELVGSAKSIAQFLDRDTRPDFSSTVMIPSIQSFIKNPNDIPGLLKGIESQAKGIFTA